MQDLKTPPPNVIDPSKRYAVTVHTSRGDFTIQLVDPGVAPQTVNNFVFLAQNHYYDGLTFHRVVSGFVVQGGDPLGNGTGGPAYKLPDESNPSRSPRGTVGMASSAAGGSGSRFLTKRAAAPFLASNGVYNHFVEVPCAVGGVDNTRGGDTARPLDAAPREGGCRAEPAHAPGSGRGRGPPPPRTRPPRRW